MDLLHPSISESSREAHRETRPPLLPALTSLRFFFAFVVFLSHLRFLRANEAYKEIYDNYFEEGFLGVSFFFILSGFIITYNYFDKIVEKRISYRVFFLRRLFRVYPLHFLTLILSLISFINSDKHHEFFYIHFVLNIFLLHSFIPSSAFYFSLNNVSWSISNELFFYSLAPKAIRILNGISKNIIFFLFLFVIILGFIFVSLFLSLDFHRGINHAIVYVNPFFRFMDFILGMLLCKLYYEGKRITFIQRNSSLIQISSIVLFSLFFSFHLIVDVTFRYSVYYWIPMLAIIFSFSFSNGFFAYTLKNRILVYLGEISFAFYLLHFLVIRFTSSLALKLFPLLGIPFAGLEAELAILCFIITLILSILSFEFYEKRMNALLTKSLLPVRGSLS